MSAGRLFVVATPLGNLEDLSPRAARVLRECALVVAEDTRVTSRLLAHVGAQKPLVSCPGDAEADRIPKLLEALGRGEDLALCSDAGTPAVSDPGAKLVAAAHAAGFVVVPIAGPSAVAAALSASGFEGAGHYFAGFLPRKGEARTEAIARLGAMDVPSVLFESPERVGDTLRELADGLGPAREAVLARELTKLHEEIVRAPLGTLAERFRDGARGEVVVVLAPAPKDAPVAVDDEAIRAALAARPEAERLRDRVDAVAAALRVPRRRVYQLAVSAR